MYLKFPKLVPYCVSYKFFMLRKNVQKRLNNLFKIFIRQPFLLYWKYFFQTH